MWVWRAWMGVRPLPQLTRLSQGMRPPCQSTLTPSESRLPRQREVSQAAAETEAVQSPRPQPWPSARSARGVTGYWRHCKTMGAGSREQGAGHPTHPLTLVNHSGRGSEQGTADTSARPNLPPRLHGQLSGGSGPWPCAAGQ